MFKKIFSLLGVAFMVFCADILAKAYIHYNLPVLSDAFPVYPYGGIAVFKDWQGIDCAIVHAVNKGAAWGAFASFQQALLYVRLLIIGGLLSYLFFVKNAAYSKGALTLVTVGAIGNVVDYFIYGHVIDMFYFVFWGYSYPVFNIADSAIFCGILFLLMRSLFQKKKKAPRAATR